MEICCNKDFEGKISKISDMEHSSNDFFFKYKFNSNNYIIGINIYNNTHIIISIARENNIVLQKYFTFEKIQKYDSEFFVPFNNNILLLFKFIIRLLNANLFALETIIEGNQTLFYLNLYCLKDSSLRPITIDLNIDDDKEINIDSAPAIRNKNIAFKLEINDKNKTNKTYKIELRIIEHKYENEIYKEIEIKFTNTKETKIYYDYLNPQDIFDRSIPYYQLFNDSIEDVYDDLKIIIYHNNYYFEEHNQSIKFFFQVFNIGKNSNAPYFYIFIEALNRERTDLELQSKMKEYFQYKLKKEQHSENIENIDEFSEEKVKRENKKIKKEIKKNNNSQIKFMLNFLSMNKNSNSNTEKKIEKNEIKKEDNEQTSINESKNKHSDIEKNKLVKEKFRINKPNIKNNENSIFNFLEKEKEKSKYDSNFMNQKRYTDLPIDWFLKTAPKNEENKSSENKESTFRKNKNNIKNSNNDMNNNINKKNNILKNNDINNNDIIKESNNYSLEIKEQKKDKKLNIDNLQNQSINKSEDISMNYKLNENGYYNINKEEVVNNYLNLVYVHPLDNDDEYKVIEDKEGQQQFYLCMICNRFFNSKNSVREHQWEKHLKPFGKKIQKDLKTKYIKK